MSKKKQSHPSQEPSSSPAPVEPVRHMLFPGSDGDPQSDPQGPKKPRKKVTISGFLFACASVIIILAGLKAAQSIVAPFFLSVFIAVILIPPLHWLESKGFSRIMSFSIISSVVLISGIIMIWVLAYSVNRFVVKIPEYQQSVNTTLTQVDSYLEPFGLSMLGGVKHKPQISGKQEAPSESVTVVENRPEQENEENPDETQTNESTSEDFSLQDDPHLNELMESLPINTIGIVSFLRKGVQELSVLIGLTVIVLVMVVFMVLEASRMPKKILEAFGSKGITNDHLKTIAEETWRYIMIKGVISLVNGTCTTIFLWLMGIDYYLLWGILAFFFNFIPNLGSVIASIPPIALGLFDYGFGTCLIVSGGLIAINWILGYYFEPMYLGDGLGLSPLVVLLSLIFWGWLLGVTGMFLSAPLTMCLKIVLNSFDDTKWVSLLMDNK